MPESKFCENHKVGENIVFIIFHVIELIGYPCHVSPLGDFGGGLIFELAPRSQITHDA